LLYNVPYEGEKVLKLKIKNLSKYWEIKTWSWDHHKFLGI
jgi:hypothetical protein